MSVVVSIKAGEKVRAVRSGHAVWMAVMLVGLGLLMALSMSSLLLGVRPVALSTALDALSAMDGNSVDHIVIVDYRLPRTLLALMGGAAFGVSGALIQAGTRNPLADPGILGVNAGSAFCVTLAVGLFGFQSIHALLWFAFLGAIIVTLAVYSLAATGRDAAAPVRLVLAGVALSALLGGIGSAITLLNPQAFDALRQWAIGSVAGRDMAVVSAVAPFIGIGLLIAMVCAPSLNAVALGDDLARSLGSSLVRTRVLTLIAVMLLAGAGTAACGPIGFVGLMVPHAVRWFTGPDQRSVIPMTMIYAPVLLLAADIAGRLVLYPGELEAGIVTAFLGAPVLILLARRRQASGL